MIELLVNLPWGEIRFSEWIQIGIGIGTIIVTVAIYRQQKKSAQQQAKHLLAEKATQFAINNQDEIEFLPLCVLASDLHRTEKHTRRIYTRFCECSDELQAEIIAQAEVDDIIHASDEEVLKWIDLLENDIANFNLGRNLLYDGAKYFTRGFERYRNEPWCSLDSLRIFKRILPCSALTAALESDKITFSSYVEEYIEWKNSCESESDKEIISPIEYMCQETQWQSVDEKTACMWVLEVVKSICVAMYKRHSEEYEINDLIPIRDVEPETFEDMYYIAVQWLYTAYGEICI